MRDKPLGVQNVVLFNKEVGWAGDWGFSLDYPIPNYKGKKDSAERG
jgi:hypothetical protein